MAKKTEKMIGMEFSKAQYETLVRALEVAGGVYGILGDLVGDGYKKNASALQDLESWVLGKAGDFGMAKHVEIFEGENVLTEKAASAYLDDLLDYEDWAFWDLLAEKMAERELARLFTPKQLKAMTWEQRMGRHAELVDRFYDEFDKHDLKNVEVKMK